MPKGTAKVKERLNLKKESLFLFSCCALLFLFLLITFNFDNYFSSLKVLGTNIETGTEEKLFWEDFLAKNPQYFAGWIELAKIYYTEGNKDAGSSALIHAQKVNPNSEEIRTLGSNLKD